LFAAERLSPSARERVQEDQWDAYCHPSRN
jgi:hypothetical protein